MPTIDLGSVVGPQGEQGNTGAQGPQGVAGPSLISTSTQTTLTGVLAGDGSVVGVRTVDASPTANSTNLVTSGGVLNAINGAKLMRFPTASVSATTGDIVSISNENINGNWVLVRCVFQSPVNIPSDVTWTSASGSFKLNGTCRSAMTADITIGCWN